jgi:hypothetical protein
LKIGSGYQEKFAGVVNDFLHVFYIKVRRYAVVAQHALIETRDQPALELDIKKACSYKMLRKCAMHAAVFTEL